MSFPPLPCPSRICLFNVIPRSLELRASLREEGFKPLAEILSLSNLDQISQLLIHMGIEALDSRGLINKPLSDAIGPRRSRGEPLSNSKYFRIELLHGKDTVNEPGVECFSGFQARIKEDEAKGPPKS